MSLSEGRRLRDLGAALAGSSADDADRWRMLADAWLDTRTDWSVFSSSDLLDAIGAPPVPNMAGAVFLHAHRAGRIMPVGYVQSRRTTSHAGVIRTWQVKR